MSPSGKDITFVSQHPYPDGCWLACLAMLVGIDMEEAVRAAGGAHRFNFDEHDRFCAAFGLKLRRCVVVEGYGEKCLGALVRGHEVVIACWSSCIDPGYAHETLISGSRCYDPWCGVDPSYPWHRYVSRAKIYVRSPSSSDGLDSHRPQT